MSDTAAYLRGEFLETLSPECTCRRLRFNRHHRRDGQVESSVKRNGLAHDGHVTAEAFDLTAQRGEAACDGSDIIDVTVRVKEAIERGLDQHRFCGTGSAGGSFQPRGKMLREMEANWEIHGR